MVCNALLVKLSLNLRVRTENCNNLGVSSSDKGLSDLESVADGSVATKAIGKNQIREPAGERRNAFVASTNKVRKRLVTLGHNVSHDFSIN